MDRVGLIGYGAMGTEFAARMRQSASINPVVYDVDEKARARAVADGSQVVDSPAALGAICEIVDVIVRTDEESIDATIGPEGAARDAQPGTVFLLHSSILPKTTIEIANAVAERKIKVADACASGTPEDIRSQRLIFLLGASPELADEVRQHLLRMAAQVVHVGPLGSGNVAKLIKNLINASERLIVWESLQTAEAAGISYVDALNMLETVGVTHERVTQRWREIFDPSGADLTPRSGTNLFDKDVPLAAELARSYGLRLPITEQLAASAKLLVTLNEARS